MRTPDGEPLWPAIAPDQEAVADRVPAATTGCGARIADGHVQILLGARDGARFLAEQLRSLEAQSHSDWTLVAGDDGSRDDSAGILRDFTGVAPHPGPQRGIGAHYLSLLSRADPDRFAAFCDQDDVWLPHKLARALQVMAAGPDEIVAYASATIQTDARLRERAHSRLPSYPPSFGNALVQNILAGNTLVLSPAAVRLVQESCPAAIRANVAFHDWWSYLVIAGAGGRIVIDPLPGLLYRQHRRNSHGAHRGPAARVRRAGQVLTRRYAGWIAANLAALQEVAGCLTPRARHTLADFVELRRQPGFARPGRFCELGIRRQHTEGDLALRLMRVTRLL